MQSIIKKISYNKLVNKIKKEIVFGAESIQAFARRQTVKSYWNIGRDIEHYIQDQSKNNFYGEQLYQHLSDDIGIHNRTLYKCSQLYRVYPNIDLDLPLSWSHYRYLVQIHSSKKRLKWEKRVIKENLASHTFLALLHEKPPSQKPITLKPVVRGKIYHYRLVKLARLLLDKSRLYIDCGFENYIDPPSQRALSNTRIYRCQKEDGRYTLKLSNALKEVLYTYSAEIERIIDADTFLVCIDCGFGIKRRERLRLSGIDAPEKSSIMGVRAIQWVKSKLKGCSSIVIQTSKSDKYDRYLSDIFYLPNCNDSQKIADQGLYLNQQMVQEGVAKLWE